MLIRSLRLKDQRGEIWGRIRLKLWLKRGKGNSKKECRVLRWKLKGSKLFIFFALLHHFSVVSVYYMVHNTVYNLSVLSSVPWFICILFLVYYWYTFVVYWIVHCKQCTLKNYTSAVHYSVYYRTVYTICSTLISVLNSALNCVLHWCSFSVYTGSVYYSVHHKSTPVVLQK